MLRQRQGHRHTHPGQGRAGRVEYCRVLHRVIGIFAPVDKRMRWSRLASSIYRPALDISLFRRLGRSFLEIKRVTVGPSVALASLVWTRQSDTYKAYLLVLFPPLPTTIVTLFITYMQPVLQHIHRSSHIKGLLRESDFLTRAARSSRSTDHQGNGIISWYSALRWHF